MKIMKLTSTALSYVCPIVVKKSNNLYYNIKHGSRGDKLHSYSIGLDATKFKPKDTADSFYLKDDNYALLPIYKNKNIQKDTANNTMYFISTDEMDVHKNDYIILWEIPNKFYTDVSYKMSGSVNVLGVGKIGRSRDGIDYISPAPILEAYGACKLSWTAYKNDTVYKQDFTFDGEQWSIGQITIDKGDKDGE